MTGSKGKHRFEGLSKKIIGAAIKVHKELGPGYLENIYEQAMKLVFTEGGLNFEHQKEIKIKYLGTLVGIHRLDLLVENRSYLKATGLKVGLLINFAKPTLEVKRIVN